MDSHYLNEPKKTKEQLITARDAWLSQYQKIRSPDKWKTVPTVPVTQSKTGSDSLKGAPLPIIPAVPPQVFYRTQQAPINLNAANNPEPLTQQPADSSVDTPPQPTNAPTVDDNDAPAPTEMDTADVYNDYMVRRPQARVNYAARNFNPPWTFNTRIVDPASSTTTEAIPTTTRTQRNDQYNREAVQYQIDKQTFEDNIQGVLKDLQGVTDDYGEAINIHTLASKSLPFAKELEMFRIKHGSSDTQTVINNNALAYQNKMANFDPFASSDRFADMNIEHMKEAMQANSVMAVDDMDIAETDDTYTSAIVNAFTSVAQKAFDAITDPYALMAASALAPFPINAGLQYFANQSRTSLIFQIDKLLAFGFQLLADIRQDYADQQVTQLATVATYLTDLLSGSEYNKEIESKYSEMQAFKQGQVLETFPNSATAEKIEHEQNPDGPRAAMATQTDKYKNYLRSVAKTYGIEDAIINQYKIIDDAYATPISNALGTDNQLNKKYDQNAFVANLAFGTMSFVTFQVLKQLATKPKEIGVDGKERDSNFLATTLQIIVDWFLTNQDMLTANTSQAWGLITAFVFSAFQINMGATGEVSSLPKQQLLRKKIEPIIGKGIGGAQELTDALLGYKKLLNDNIPMQRKNTIITKILDLLDTIPAYKTGGMMKKDTKGCSFCGGKQDLMVHYQDPNDITCKDCLNKNSMTGGRFTKREVDIIPEEESTNEEHINNNKQNKINKYLDDLETTTPSTMMEEFDASAPIDKRFLTRMSNDFIIARPYDSPRFETKDLDRLTYLVGLSEHSPETMTTSQKVNMEALAIKHLDKSGDPKATFPNFNKFDTFANLQDQLKTNPGILKRLIS